MMKNRINKIIQWLSFLFLLFWGLCYCCWLFETKVTGVGLMLSFFVFMIFVKTILDCRQPLIDYWSSFEVRQNSKIISYKNTILIAAAWLVFVNGILVMQILKSYPEHNFLEAMSSYWRGLTLDSNSYFKIAEMGYPSTGSDKYILVFFPFYPFLIRLLTYLTKHTVLSSLIISQGFAVLDLILFRRLTEMELKNPKRDADFATLLLVISPGFMFCLFPMTESLFLFFCLSAVLCVKNNRWLLAGIWGYCAALTRSAGILVLVYFLVELIRRWIQEGFQFEHGLALVLPCAGLCSYLYLNFIVSGNPFQFSIYQMENWSMSLNWFFNTVKYQWEYIQYYLNNQQWVLLVSLMIPGMLTVLFSFVILWLGTKKISISLMGFSLAYAVFSMGASWLLSGPRYMAILFSLPMILSQCVTGTRFRRAYAVMMFLISLIYFIWFLKRYAIY